MAPSGPSGEDLCDLPTQKCTILLGPDQMRSTCSFRDYRLGVIRKHLATFGVECRVQETQDVNKLVIEVDGERVWDTDDVRQIDHFDDQDELSCAAVTAVFKHVGIDLTAEPACVSGDLTNINVKRAELYGSPAFPFTPFASPCSPAGPGIHSPVGMQSPRSPASPVPNTEFHCKVQHFQPIQRPGPLQQMPMDERVKQWQEELRRLSEEPAVIPSRRGSLWERRGSRWESSGRPSTDRDVLDSVSNDGSPTTRPVG